MPATSPAPEAGTHRPRRRRISWDLVRAGCVMLVMLYHATFLSVILHPELQARRFVLPVQVGASLLLVVSAYFACVTIGRGSVLRYWWGRVARLVPPFAAAVVAIYLLLRWAGPAEFFFPTPRDLAANLLMLWHWYPQDYYFIDGSHWTIPLQLLGFTAAAVLYRTRWGRTERIHVVLWSAVLLPMLQWPIRISHPPEVYRILVDGVGMHRWHLFVAGVAIWLWSNGRLSARHFLSLVTTCVAAQLLHSYADTSDGLVADWRSTIAVGVGLVVVALTAYGPDWDRVIPTWTMRPVRWFAEISYGVFLMHQTAGYVVSRHLQDHGVGPTLQTAAMLVTGVVLGWALTRLVEQPSHRFLMSAYDRGTARLRAAG